jgi:hypothetical protein
MLERMHDADGRDPGHRLARRSFLVGGVTLAIAAGGGRLVGAAAKPTIAVHRSPT